MFLELDGSCHADLGANEPYSDHERRMYSTVCTVQYMIQDGIHLGPSVKADLILVRLR